MMPLVKRKISYISGEENLKQKVDYAMTLTMEDRMKIYYQLIKMGYIMAGYDVDKLRVKRKIYYIDERDNK